MTNAEILKAALEKAAKNGFIFDDVVYYGTLGKDLYFYTEKGRGLIPSEYYFKIIFSHEFAEALNYKLKDLGEWCDDGKEALQYIQKFLYNVKEVREVRGAVPVKEYSWEDAKRVFPD